MAEWSILVSQRGSRDDELQVGRKLAGMGVMSKEYHKIRRVSPVEAVSHPAEGSLNLFESSV